MATTPSKRYQVFGQLFTVYIGSRVYYENGLEVEFEVNYDSNSKGKASDSKLTIYNLSQDTINSLKEGQLIKIDAGYSIISKDKEGKFSGTIITGEITRFGSEVVGKNRGGDVPTTIYIGQDTNRWYTSYVVRTWAAGTAAIDIVEGIIKDAGFNVGFIDESIIYVYRRPWSYNGKMRDALTEIANDCNARVYNEGSNIYFVRQGKTVIDTIEILPEHILDSPTPKEKGGFIFRTILIYSARPGLQVNIQSKYLEGKYVATAIKHIKSSDGSQFYTEWEVQGDVAKTDTGDDDQESD